MKNLTYLAIMAFCFSCAATKKANQPSLLDNRTFLLTEISTNSDYGTSPKDPIKVGGVEKSQGPLNEQRFLNALAGPNGEDVSFFRSGSCCSFKTKNGFMGAGLLDVYKVTWVGSSDTLSLYLNMYDYGPLKAPAGFTIRK